MSNRTNEHLRAVLTAIEDIAPEPPPLPAASSIQPIRRRPLLVAVAAFVAVLIVIGVGTLTLTRRVDGNQETATTPSSQPTTTITVEPVAATPAAYGLGPDAEGWEIRGVLEDRDGNRLVSLLDMNAGPSDEEGVLPGLLMWVGPSAERQLAAIDAGVETAEWTFPLQGAEAAVIASGTDAGVVVWRTPEGRAVSAEYNRLGHQEAQDLLQKVEPINQPEWDILIEGNGHQIDAIQVNDVWAFRHDPQASDHALHSGTAAIVDDCLRVGDAIVVWPVERFDEATDLIAAIKNGATSQVVIGGGGISLDEGSTLEQIPPIITDHCPTDVVWYGAP